MYNELPRREQATFLELLHTVQFRNKSFENLFSCGLFVRSNITHIPLKPARAPRTSAAQTFHYDDTHQLNMLQLCVRRCASLRVPQRTCSIVTRQQSTGSLSNLTDILSGGHTQAQTYIHAYDDYGFTVSYVDSPTRIHVRGSACVFRDFTLLWDVQDHRDISPRNAAVFHMISPKPGTILPLTFLSYMHNTTVY
jgi:hypothetical protein